MQKVQGWSESGGISVVVPGTQGSGSQRFQQSFRGATITVYLTGTLTLATIYSDDNLTAKANPFTASTTTGAWSFYAANGAYDIKFSGGGISAPFTLGDVRLFDESILFIDVTSAPYLAVGDGSTNNDTALALAVADVGSSGAVIYFPPGSYKTTVRFTINKSNVEVLFANGAEILFQPVAPIVSANDRAVLVYSGDAAIGNSVNVTGAVAKGATSFVAASTAGISAGDWLLVQETDAGSGDNIVVFDYVQVLSIVGTTVNFVMPINQSFPATHSTVFFNRVADASLVNNVIITNAKVRTTDTSNNLPGFFVGVARNVTIQNCQSIIRKGNGYGSYRAANVRIIDCYQSQIQGQATEFASCAGLIIDGLISGTNSIVQPDTSALVLDFGTHSFSVTNCVFGAAANIAVQMAAIQDGEFANNTILYILGPAAYNTQGISMLGCQNVSIESNRLLGGEGAASTGMATSDTTGYTVEIASSGNLLANNIVNGFTSQFSIVAADLWIAPTSGNDGGYQIGRYLTLRHTTNPFLRLHKLNATAQIWELNGGDAASFVDSTGGGTVVWSVTKSGSTVRMGVGASSTDASAKLAIVSTTQGFLPPVMTTAQRDLISGPAPGLVIFNSSTGVLNFYNGATWGAV